MWKTRKYSKKNRGKNFIDIGVRTLEVTTSIISDNHHSWDHNPTNVHENVSQILVQILKDLNLDVMKNQSYKFS